MGFGLILLIAIGLSMDSFAVSVANGLCVNNLGFKKALVIAFSLSLFQASFPIAGYYLGISFEKYIVEFDHWIAFVLLAFIGIQMIFEGINKSENKQCYDLSYKALILQSVGTSIDAFIIGVSFALFNYNIFKAAIIIFITTFIFSMIGLKTGKIIGLKLGKIAEIIGGSVLILIGIKILIEHLYF